MEHAAPTKNLADVFILSLPWIMLTIFVVSGLLRLALYYMVRRQDWFAREFEKRAGRFVEVEKAQSDSPLSFYMITKKMLEKTYYESFELRDRLKRRRDDHVMSVSDRIFLIRQGCAWLVRDILKQVRFVKWTEDSPNLLGITKSSLQHNPCFNRLFGFIPVGGLNDMLSMLPGLFVVAGILGTFLGIAKGLPTLSDMNLQELENSKLIMDRFLNEIAFAMQSSIAGIAFSLLLHLWNTMFSPERTFIGMVDRLQAGLDLLWYRADNNEFPREEAGTAADSQETMASESVQSELNRNPRGREYDKVHKVRAS